jgi:glycosyltransferase involved in cell wall biosynthesis
MKIAIVSARATTRVAELSAALTRCGHDVSLFTRRTDPDRGQRIQAPRGYKVFHVTAGPADSSLSDDGLLKSMGPFAQYLDEAWAAERPDIAHAQCWMTGIASQLVTRRLRLPAVQTFQGLGMVSEEQLQMEATVARTANWVAATCTDDVFRLMQMGRPRGSISVVPCGVDEELFAPHGPQDEKTAKYRIVSVGKLLPRKGFDDIIRAMPKIPHAELVIAGGSDTPDLHADSEANRLRDLADELGVARRVHLYGSVVRDKLPALLRSADVVACNPWRETSGSVALEAMACGVPVVASAVGASLDIVVHDVTGRLVPPRDPAKMAYAINVLLHDGFLRKSLGAAGRDRARARYSWDRIAVDMLRIYERVGRMRNARITTSA